MFTDAARAASGLTATTNPTVPFPLALCGVATIQFTGLVAFHVHPPSVDTSTDRRPPADAIASPPWLSLNVHGAGAWVKPTLCEPTTMALERDAGTGFGATVNGTVPSPWPPASLPIETQAALVLIDHVQSREVATVSDPWPPLAVNDVGALLTLTWHLSAVGDVIEVVVLLQPPARLARAKATRNAEGRQRIRCTGCDACTCLATIQDARKAYFDKSRSLVCRRLPNR